MTMFRYQQDSNQFLFSFTPPFPITHCNTFRHTRAHICVIIIPMTSWTLFRCSISGSIKLPPQHELPIASFSLPPNRLRCLKLTADCLSRSRSEHLLSLACVISLTSNHWVPWDPSSCKGVANHVRHSSDDSSSHTDHPLIISSVWVMDASFCFLAAYISVSGIVLFHVTTTMSRLRIFIAVSCSKGMAERWTGELGTIPVCLAMQVCDAFHAGWGK